jgi:hypothetical protein
MNDTSSLPNIKAFRRPLGETLAASGAPLNQPETPRPNQADLKAFEDKMQEEANWKAFDHRGAAALNLIKLCMIQRRQEDFTNADMEHFRAIMGVGNLIVAGDPLAEVPSGFGEPVRVAMASEVQEALAAIAASVAVVPDGDKAQVAQTSQEERK